MTRERWLIAAMMVAAFVCGLFAPTHPGLYLILLAILVGACVGLANERRRARLEYEAWVQYQDELLNDTRPDIY